MTTLTRETLLQTVADLARIPVEEMGDPQSLLQRLPAIETRLRTRIIGQAEAIDACMGQLRSRLLYQRTDRPVMQLLFVGPSGVGKTELALQLTSAYAGTTEALVRLDGSEYAEELAVAKLVGTAPGYVGYHDGGMLTEAVRRRPRSVVLFDEVEKASMPVINAFLQVMSAGHLTDGHGERVDFRRTLLIFTGNIGNRYVGNAAPEGDAYARQIEDAVRVTLPPEFLSRLDGMVVFRHLNREHLAEVVHVKLADMAQSLRGVAGFDIAPDATQALAQEAYQPDLGAREVARVLQRRIEPGILQLIARGDIRPEIPRMIQIGLDAGEYVLEVRSP